MNSQMRLDRVMRAGRIASLASVLTTLVTGAACLGPMLGIVLGVSVLGGLSRYAPLQLPATLMTLALLLLGYWGAFHRAGGDRCAHRRNQHVFYAATAFALVVNGVEYLLFPRLA